MRLSVPLAASLAGLALALAACSGEREEQSADDFADRIGGAEGTAAPSAQDSAPVTTPPPANVALGSLEPLGDIAGTDLGPRDGACTFTAGSNPLLMAGAPADPASRGKAVVRIGGKLYLLASAGGMAAIREGTSFTAEGVTVAVSGSGQTARLEVTDETGNSQAVVGSWVCA